MGECFFAAEERGRTRKIAEVMAGEFSTTNDTNHTNEGEGGVGDLKLERREKLSVVTDGEPFSVSVKWNRTGS
ncbi:MAG: hypothetical protein RIT02_1937, partial [Planctomycetota bacterium]